MTLNKRSRTILARLVIASTLFAAIVVLAGCEDAGTPMIKKEPKEAEPPAWAPPAWLHGTWSGQDPGPVTVKASKVNLVVTISNDPSDLAEAEKAGDRVTALSETGVYTLRHRRLEPEPDYVLEFQFTEVSETEVMLDLSRGPVGSDLQPFLSTTLTKET